jgi:hypothetical protein
MLTLPELPRSLLVFLVIVVGGAAALGHLWAGLGVAAFTLALVAIDAKPSWKRIWNPGTSGGDRDGLFARTAHRTAGSSSPRDRTRSRLR